MILYLAQLIKDGGINAEVYNVSFFLVKIPTLSHTVLYPDMMSRYEINRKFSRLARTVMISFPWLLTVIVT